MRVSCRVSATLRWELGAAASPLGPAAPGRALRARQPRLGEEAQLPACGMGVGREGRRAQGAMKAAADGLGRAAHALPGCVVLDLSLPGAAARPRRGGGGAW